MIGFNHESGRHGLQGHAQNALVGGSRTILAVMFTRVIAESRAHGHGHGIFMCSSTHPRLSGLSIVYCQKTEYFWVRNCRIFSPLQPLPSSPVYSRCTLLPFPFVAFFSTKLRDATCTQKTTRKTCITRTPEKERFEKVTSGNKRLYLLSIPIYRCTRLRRVYSSPAASVRSM
jgi:hypothetical protein